MILFQKKSVLSVKDDKTNIIHKFSVPENIGALKIKYEYSPKEVADRELAVNLIKDCFKKYDEHIVGRPSDYLPVKNLLTLSLDDKKTYRGASHRQSNNQEILISADNATAGYEKGDITPGQWTAVISVHSISCDVDYKLQVEGEEIQ